MSDIDPEIPRRAKRGDRQAFAQLVDFFYPRGLRFARQMLGNVQDAEEALQDTFVRVYDNLAKFRDDARFEPWLFHILANRCRTLAAKQKRHHAVIDYGDLPLDAAAASETRDEWTAEVHRALDRLPAEQREAFLLRHVEGMEYEDMAIVTGAGLSTLRMRVKRASDALRVRLREVELYG